MESSEQQKSGCRRAVARETITELYQSESEGTSDEAPVMGAEQQPSVMEELSIKNRPGPRRGARPKPSEKAFEMRENLVLITHLWYNLSEKEHPKEGSGRQ